MVAVGMYEESLVNVANLVTHYGHRQILHNVDFRVRPGEIVIIMGGSGSGKSTLLRHLLGLHTATSGTIQLFGVDTARASMNQLYELRKQIGVAFQGGALFSSLSVGENVKLPLVEHTKLDEKTMDIMMRMKLEVVDLGGFEDLMPAQLSGGMIKRAALARAIIMDPKLLCFDEPSAGLDPVVAAELDELILRLRDAMGMSIVVVTHELESAMRISDRIVILDQGRVLMDGTIEEVKNSDSDRVQDLLNRRPRNEEIDPDTYLRRLAGEN